MQYDIRIKKEIIGHSSLWKLSLLFFPQGPALGLLFLDSWGS